MLEGKSKPDYQSYVLRLWLVRENEGESDGNGDGDGENHLWVCRASLQPIPGGLRRGFVNLRALFDYLEEQTESQTRPSYSPTPPDSDD